jgi:Lipoprotein amino terminal region
MMFFSLADVYIETRKTLIYDHSFSPKPMKHDIVLSRDYLKQMCALGSPNIQRDFPDKYVKFLSASKQLSAKGLNQLLFRAAGICPSGRKHVLESLPYIGSSASIDLMKDIIMGKVKAKEVNSEIIEEWMLSMFYLPRPDSKVIESMFSLMQYYETNQNPMFVLIPTSVTHTYCKHTADCLTDIRVVNVVKYLERIVSENLPKDLNERKTYEKLLVALKGIGNIGHVSKSLRSELQDIIVDESYSDDIKIQAIQVFRKTQCDQTREYFLDIYQNFTQSVEVRIASYLQLMKCPTYLTVNNIKAFLLNERVNQVGSFVFSHLINMARTSSPQKIELQALLGYRNIFN